MSQPQQNEVPGFDPPAEKIRDAAQLAQLLAAGISAYRNKQVRKSFATQELIQQLDQQATAEAQPRPMSGQEHNQVKGLMRAADQNPTEERWARKQYLGELGQDEWSVIGGAEGLVSDVSVVVSTERQADALVEGIKDPEILSLEQLTAMQPTPEPVTWDRKQRREHGRLLASEDARRDARNELLGEVKAADSPGRAVLDGMERKAQQESNGQLMSAVQQRRQALRADELAGQGASVRASDVAPQPIPQPEQEAVSSEASGEVGAAEASGGTSTRAAAEASSQPGPAVVDDLVVASAEEALATEQPDVETLKQRYPRTDPWNPQTVTLGGEEVQGAALDQAVLDRVVSWDPANSAHRERAAQLWDLVTSEEARAALSGRFDGLAEAMAAQEAPVAEGQDPHTAQVDALQQQPQGRKAAAAQAAVATAPNRGAEQAAQQATETAEAAGAPSTDTKQGRTAAPQQAPQQQAPQR